MALINKIIPFSCVDGVGNRMVIFFQGCNIKCKYCHNPETINKCISCAECVSYCESKALDVNENGQVTWNKEKCIGCDICISNCRYLSTPKTIDYNINELFKEIEKAKLFIQGITVSGGECTLNAKFLVELFKKVKSIGLTCFVDTNGTIDLEKERELFELTDKFMLDIKSIDDKESIELTGNTNKIAIKNLDLILKANKMYEVRTVVANRLNSEKTVDAVSKFIGNKSRYKLIKYRKYGVREEGITFHGNESPNDDFMNRLKELSKNNGCENTIIT
ncbi:MAG: YjjW family glycine radical enzyme activase [Sarcina sp.]